MDARRVIGHDGGIPWHHPEDLKHFRRVTLGHAVIMGRATYESMGRPLPRRHNIVVTRDRGRRFEGCEVAHDLEAAVALARTRDPEPFIIGGAGLYEQALPLATRIYLTLVPGEHAGDTFFPQLDPDAFHEVERREGADGLTFLTLARQP